jgi:HK97 gp10 family phage protein
MNKTDKFIKTYGFNALKRTLDNMAYKDKRRILISALKRASKPTLEMAVANSPVGRTGNLKKSIGQIGVGNEIAIIIGARTKGGFKGFHGHLVNDGTVDRHYITKLGNEHKTGKMSVTKSYFHFFTRAVDATEDHAINTLSNEWQKGVAKMIIKDNKLDT